MFANPGGLQGLLKDGGKHFAGVDETLLKNIEAVKALSNITRTSLGPNGTNKLIINHLNKHFVTSDTGTIVQELEVAHPAAKMVVMAARAQEQECGDGTNLCVTLAGSLLQGAEELLQEGIHGRDVLRGIEAAKDKALELLQEQVAWRVEDLHSVDCLKKAMKTTVSSKIEANSDLMTDFCADACAKVIPQVCQRPLCAASCRRQRLRNMVLPHKT